MAAPLALLAAGTLLIAAAGLDLSLERVFYLGQGNWLGRTAQPWPFLYRYGVLPAYLCAGGALLALVVALIPTWTDLPPTRLRFGPAAGVALAAVSMGGTAIILRVGGWTPITPPVPGDVSWVRLLADAWAPALVEEPLLRGALPALVAPVVGWWGAALLAAPVGALLHPVPSVPLAASLALELVLQIGLAVVARFSGVGGAILARGTCDALVSRASFPAGSDWERAALAGVVFGMVILLWPRRSE